MAKLSCSIMAHPSRKTWIPELLNQLPTATTVWDEKNEVWDTGKRALQAFEPDATHHLVVQDDAVLSKDFWKTCQNIVEHSGKYPVALYMGRTSRYYCRRADTCRGPWFALEGPRWGPAIILPTACIPEAVAWGDQDRKTRGYDGKLTRYFRYAKTTCLYTVPSLVDHRGVRENPSLFAGRTADRHAYKFTGESAVEVDWSIPPDVRPRHR